MPSDSFDEERSRRRIAKGEHRVPPACAVLVAIATYALLPDSLLIGPRFVVPGVEGVLLIALLIVNPMRLTSETRWSRVTSASLALLVIVANLVALAMLISTLNKDPQGTSLLVAAMQVWLTNVIGFALLYWELDRGGPVARRMARRDQIPPADWRFSQDENADNVSEVARTASATSGWIPTFVDFLYVSLTNSSAFSPTDTMPLSTRAKVLMGVQATAALLTSLLIIARAIGSFGG